MAPYGWAHRTEFSGIASTRAGRSRSRSSTSGWRGPSGFRRCSSVVTAASWRVSSGLDEAPDGTLWGGDVDGSIWKLEGGVPRIVNHDLAERIVAIIATRDGRSVWAASLGTGAVRIDTRQPENRMVVTRANGLL